MNRTLTTLAAALLYVAVVSCSPGGGAHGGRHEGEHLEPHGAHLEQEHEEHEHEGHEDEDGAGSHEGHDHEGVVHLSAEDVEDFGISVERAGPGEITHSVTLPGEVRLNEDSVVHVVPRLRGVVRDVRKTLGDRVRRGEVMAVIESSELAEAAAAHVASNIRLRLAEATFQREMDLYEKKITSLDDFLAAKQRLIEARIEHEKAEQMHQALDIEEQDHGRGGGRHGLPSSRYEIIAPFGGTVISRHISLGEVLKADAEAYVLADLGSVWVDLSVYRKDLPYVREGQRVTVRAGHGIPDQEGAIHYVGPVVGEQTRTALARIILPNRGGLWRPGLFVNGVLETAGQGVDVRVPENAVLEVHEEPSVFVAEGDGFALRHVRTGIRGGGWVEVLHGLAPGESYVAEGTFTLKAQLDKGSFGHGHVH